MIDALFIGASGARAVRSIDDRHGRDVYLVRHEGRIVAYRRIRFRFTAEWYGPIESPSWRWDWIPCEGPNDLDRDRVKWFREAVVYVAGDGDGYVARWLDE